MKKLLSVKYLLPFFLSFFIGHNLYAQQVTDDFNYNAGTLLTANGYTSINGTTNLLTVTSPGLLYAGSPSSNVGNAVTMATSGEDVTKSFTPSITAGDVYASLFINVSSAQATGDYFFALNDGTSYKLKLFIKSSGAGYVFGIGKNAGTALYETTVRTFNTTNLVVVKYTFNAGSTTDDAVSLYVNPALGLPEPGVATIPATTNGNATDAALIDRFALRQGSATAASAQIVDGIRVGTTWAYVTPVSSPTVTSISPNTATASDPGFTLTVNGTNFTNNNSAVTWNGSIRTTTFVSATQLTATIPSSDLLTAAVIPVGVTTTGAASVSNTQNFTINAATGGTFALNTAPADFGNNCINTTSNNSFTFSGNNLNGSSITVTGPAGYTFSEISGGTYSSSVNFTYTGSSFSNKIIYVRFTPTAVQSYNGNILINGGGVTNYPLPVTGAGVNDAPFVTTNPATAVGATTATLSGTITSQGCAPVTSYGFEYSTSSGFLNGTGTVVPSSNLTAGTFTATLTGLIPNTRYYYKAFAVSSIGTTYGSQMAFTNTALPVPMASQPGLSFTETFADIANWSNFFITGIGANHFTGLGATGAGGIPTPTTLTSSTFSFQNPNPGPPVTPSTSGGVHRGTDQVPATQSIVLLSTGSPDNTTSAAIDFYMDFTGVNAGTLSFDYAVVNNSTGNRNGSLRIYATVDGVSFTELTFADVLDFTNNVALSGTKSNIALPAIFNNNANARLRFYYHNGSGNTGSGSRPKISIDNLNVTALATTPCGTPTAPATSLVFGTITDTTIAGSFTASSPATDSYLIVMSTNSTLNSFPVNGQTYNIGDNVGDGSVISKNMTTTFTATGLSAQTTYYFFVFPMNAICTGGPLYYTSNILTGTATTIAGLPPCAAPATQPTNLTFGTAGTTTITGNFTSTTADQYLVVRSTSSTLSVNPANGTSYNSGDILGNGTVVQRGTGNSFTATGLSPNTIYYFFVFSLNSQACINGPAYNINAPLTANQSTIPLPPCTTPTAQGTSLAFRTANTSVSGTFTGTNSADNYLIIKSTNPVLSVSPADNTDYNSGDVFGNGTVLTTTSATTFYATSLTPNTTYYFFIFAVNKICSGGSKYNRINPLNGSTTTTNGLQNNYYFGTLHSHSDYSDGNADNPGYTPAQDYAFAKNSLCMDYLGISEHNHFSSPDNPGNQINNFHLGSVQANNFTSSNTNFLALYGMEWGVISGGGHVVVYGDNMDDLWGWETGSGTWGPTNNYDVYVPKSVYTGSTGLFKTVNDNIAKNTFATLAHPNLTDYNNVAGNAYDVVADNAIVGTAVESGPAFSTNTTYSNPGSSLSYLYYYQLMLSKGYHLGPTIDHDNHNTTFGRATTSRTAVIAPALTKTAFISAVRNMNFYATQDCDTKVDFTINTKKMGSLLTDRFGPNIFVSLSDATTSVSSALIKLMYGTPGSGINAVKIDSAIGSTLSFTDKNLADLATGYYYLDITNGTGRIITSPIWYTRNDNFNVLPVKLNTFTAKKANTAAELDWSTDQEINSSYFNVERSADGINWKDIARVNAAGNSTTTRNYRAFDNNPVNGINYYRLKQFDLDGKFEYSIIRSVSFSKAYSISVSPNPAKDFINVTGANDQSSIATIQLTDVSGKIIRSVLSADKTVNINLKGIAKGMYFIRIINGENIQTEKVIIE